MLTKISKDFETEASKLMQNTIQKKKQTNKKTPKPTVCRYFRCNWRYYGQNNMAETGFNAPMYLVLLKYNATNKN